MFFRARMQLFFPDRISWRFFALAANEHDEVHIRKQCAMRCNFNSSRLPKYGKYYVYGLRYVESF